MSYRDDAAVPVKRDEQPRNHSGGGSQKQRSGEQKAEIVGSRGEIGRSSEVEARGVQALLTSRERNGRTTRITRRTEGLIPPPPTSLQRNKAMTCPTDGGEQGSRLRQYQAWMSYLGEHGLQHHGEIQPIPIVGFLPGRVPKVLRLLTDQLQDSFNHEDKLPGDTQCTVNLWSCERCCHLDSP